MRRVVGAAVAGLSVAAAQVCGILLLFVPCLLSDEWPFMLALLGILLVPLPVCVAPALVHSRLQNSRLGPRSSMLATIVLGISGFLIGVVVVSPSDGLRALVGGGAGSFVLVTLGSLGAPANRDEPSIGLTGR